MKSEQSTSLAAAIIDAAHIIANNRATGPKGESYGGLEAHSMKIAESIDGLAAQFQELAFQMGRIADVVEGQKNA
jgi:hypothetical protein